MDSFFLNLVNMSITASWLILAVIILRLFLKKAPKAITASLWAIVAIRLIFPFSIESVLSLVPSANTIPEEIVYAREPVIDSGVDSINHIVNPIITEAFAPSTELTSINPIQVFLAVAELFWIVGIIAMTLYALISYIRIAYKIREAIYLGDRIYSCDNIPSPFILGTFRPRIIIPSKMDESDKKYVVAHEMAHIKRGDHLWKPLGFLLLTVYWFNPVIWVAYILLCRDIELACDEKVIRNMCAEDKKAYSTALLNCSMPQRMVTACPLAFGEVGVKKRIKSVLNYKKPAFWLIVAAILITVAVSVGFLTNPKEEDFSNLPDITAHAYEVEEVVYTAPYLSFMYFPGHNTPFFTITDDMYLLRKEVDETANKWTSLGKLSEFKLDKYNFDVFIEYFYDEAFRNELSAEKLRKDNAKAWRLNGDSPIFVLLQKDGTVFTTLGTNKIHHIFKLTTNIHEDMGLIAVSGENSVPIKIFSTEDSLEKIKNEVNWLDISFNDNQFTPFDIYCDGATQLGFFRIYDANTFEPLDFFLPSGLSPHTYIFQNAQDGGKYIITMRWDYSIEEGSTELLCFGAILPGVPITGTWEAPITILGIDADKIPQNATATYTFNADKTGYRKETLGVARHFTYTCLNGLLTLTFDNNSEMTEYYKYECDGKTLVLADPDIDRKIEFKKVTYAVLDEEPSINEYPNGVSYMQFFGVQGFIGNETDVSSVYFHFQKDVNHSISSGRNFDYLDNLVLRTAIDESYVLSFSIYQDTLPYINSLFSILNSTVTVDYEGKVMYDKLVNANDYIKIHMNGMPATITEVSLGAGNGHRDFYITFHTDEYVEFKEITEFSFSVNQEPVDFNVDISKENAPLLLECGDIKVYPIATTDYGEYNEFLLKSGAKQKRFLGECLSDNQWRREMYVEDLTGDGVFDITVVFQNGHGTGYAPEDIHIFDGVTLEEYRVEELYETIGDYVEFSADENFCYIQIDSKTYTVDKSSLEPYYEKTDWWEKPYTSQIFTYSVENKELIIELPCQYTPSGIVGSIFAKYKFENGEFIFSSASYEK